MYLEPDLAKPNPTIVQVTTTTSPSSRLSPVNANSRTNDRAPSAERFYITNNIVSSDSNTTNDTTNLNDLSATNTNDNTVADTDDQFKNPRNLELDRNNAATENGIEGKNGK